MGFSGPARAAPAERHRYVGRRAGSARGQLFPRLGQRHRLWVCRPALCRWEQVARPRKEFPRFTRIVVFGTQDGLRFGCLVDSPRASAALIATLHPGPRTVLDCALHLFPRVALEDAGIAPLTSMFQHNDIGPGPDR